MTARLPLALVMAFSLTSASAVAWAGPTPKDRSAAKTAWTQAKKLESQGKQDEAVLKLREAVEKDPKAQYQLDLARALARTRSLVEAVKVADEVIASKEPNTQRAKAAAAALKKDVEPKIPSLKIEIAGGRGRDVRATIDGESVAIGRDLPMDPGSYSVKARAGTAPEVAETVDLAESQHRVVTLDLDKADREIAKQPKAKGTKGNMIPAGILYGLGGASVAAGAVLGVLAFNKTSETQEACGGSVCPPELAGDVQLSQDYGTASTILFAVGGLALAAAVVLTVTVGIDHGPSDDAPKGASASLFVGLGSMGVAGRF